MIIIGIDSENLPKLLKMYMSIPDVVQVRCNYILRNKYKLQYGEECLYIACFIKNKNLEDAYLKVDQIVSKFKWDNPEYYSELLEDIKLKIDNYIFKNIQPKPLVTAD